MPNEPTASRPKLFIGSAGESLELVEALHGLLERDAEVTPWHLAFTDPNRYVLETLVDRLHRSDFGVFIFAPSDRLQMRDTTYQAVRDNVLFELGLFIGSLGRERSLFIAPRERDGLRLPSDLAGILPIEYDAARSDNDLQAALGPAATQIRRRLRDVGCRDVEGADALSSNDEITPDALAKFEFSGPDLALQELRVELARDIIKVAANGLDEDAAELIWTLGNNAHNRALRFRIDPDLVGLHVEEVDLWHKVVSDAVLAAEGSQKAKALQYVGVHHHNMVSSLEHAAEWEKRKRDAED